MLPRTQISGWKHGFCLTARPPNVDPPITKILTNIFIATVLFTTCLPAIRISSHLGKENWAVLDDLVFGGASIPGA
jgi:hypothetical protein